MNVLNTTPYAFFPYDASLAPSLPALTLIVRGTFALRPDQPAVAKATEEQKPPRGDEQYLDALGRSLAYCTDLVPTKPRGEVLVYATCHVPGGAPKSSQDVSIQVGPIQKTLRITGPRIFAEQVLGRVTPGRTAPFTVMPIRWELAFGGMSFLQNPLGRGIDPVPDDDGTLIPYLPCIEYPDSRMSDPTDRPIPAGFGPIAPSWLPRSKQQGTRDQRWAMFRAPLPPKDFDAGFYNAAPADQQLKKGYFKGDEPIVMTGLHKGTKRYASSLPGKRLRVFVLVSGRAPARAQVDNAKEREPRPEEPEKKFVEVGMHLDTIHIHADDGEMVLLWRGQAEVSTREFTEIEACYVAEEELADEPATLEQHHAKFLALQEPAPVPELPAEQAPEVPTVAEAERDKKIDAEVETQTAAMKKMLKDSKVDPKVLAELDKTSDPHAMFDLLERATWEKIRELEAMTAKMKGG